MLRDAARKDVQAKAELAAEERLLTALVGEGAASETRGKFRRMLRGGELDDKEVEVSVAEPAGMPIGQLDIPGMPPGQMINLGEMMKGMFGRSAAAAADEGRRRPRRCSSARRPTGCSIPTR